MDEAIESPIESIPTQWIDIINTQTLAVLIVLVFLMGACYFYYTTWLPLYRRRQNIIIKREESQIDLQQTLVETLPSIAEDQRTISAGIYSQNKAMQRIYDQTKDTKVVIEDIDGRLGEVEKVVSDLANDEETGFNASLDE